MDYKKLRWYCTSPIDKFKTFGKCIQTNDGILIHNSRKDNKVLAVAHLDYVADNKSFKILHDVKFQDQDDTAILNGSLDDRLGVYIITSLLPAMGLNYDILLTEGEEIGRSTAVHFETDKKYNWMFSFDRRGEDVVMYQYDNAESAILLNQYGFKHDYGSFSDICFLDSLGCIGFNFGTGYYNEHSKDHFASVNVVSRQIGKFVKFFNDNKDIKMPFEVRATHDDYGMLLNYNRQKWYDDYPMFCDLCGEDFDDQDLTYANGYFLCPVCSGHACECVSCGDIVMDTNTKDGMCEYCNGRWYKNIEKYD